MRSLLAFCAVLTLLCASTAQADDDPLLPGNGRGSLSVATGIPYVGMGEVAIGLGDRAAAGAIFGITPRVPGVGVRGRVALFDTGGLRLVVVAPLLLYPSTNSIGNAPWVLLRTSALLDYRFDCGARIGGGVGFIATSTFARIARAGGSEDFSDGAAGVRGYGADARPAAGAFATWNVTGSVPLGGRFVLFAEAALITEGFALAGRDWVGGPPFLAVLGTSMRIGS